MALICQCCSTTKHNQYCPDCIQEGVTSHIQFAQTLRVQGSTAIKHSNALLGQSRRGVISWRRLRAEVSEKERELEWLRFEMASKSQELERLTNVAVYSVSSSFADVSGSRVATRRRVVQHVTKRADDVGKRILHARRVLVQEAIGIFGVQQDKKKVWRIAGLSLPGPEQMRTLPSVELNAALVHLVHVVTLLTRYLSITLPFTPSFPKWPHVGRPSLRANVPFLNSTKYRDKAPLWMSSTIGKGDPKSQQKHRQFLTAYGLLAHSIAYLAWSQGVDGIGVTTNHCLSDVKVPATAVLQLLYELSRSPRLGERAHEPGTSLLGHLGFSLDVNHVVDAVLQHEEEGEQEWDIVDASNG